MKITVQRRSRFIYAFADAIDFLGSNRYRPEQIFFHKVNFHLRYEDLTVPSTWWLQGQRLERDLLVKEVQWWRKNGK